MNGRGRKVQLPLWLVALLAVVGFIATMPGTTRFSISMSKSQRASIISRPLLKSVAESMVIFSPMFQVGCFSACSRVTDCNSAAGILRNGPPLAVRISRRTS